MTSSGTPTAEEFKEQQQQAWTRSAAPWRKWFAEMATQSRAATELILEEAQVQPGLQVLDLASGPGDPALSLAEAVAPGGRVTAQPFFTTTRGVIAKHIEIPPPPPPGVLGPFRFAEAGSLTTALRESGFREVREQSHTIPWPFPGPPEQTWEYFREVTGMAVPAENLDQVRAEIIAALRQYYDGQRVDTTAQIISASGVR